MMLEARFSILVLLAVAAATPVVGRAADDRPLPDLRSFGVEVRKRALTDRELQAQYTFIERREEINVSKLGKVSPGPVKTYEVYPSVERGNTYKRLIAVNGEPVPKAELDRQDRVHRENVQRELSRREHETPHEREKRLRKAASERAEWDRTLDEVLELYEIKLVGRETIAGHVTVVATLEPRPAFHPRTEAGKWLKKVRGRLWISETDFQVARAFGEVIEDVTFGWGVIGRLHKGTTAQYERRKINGEVWLPARTEIKGSGRALLLRRFSLSSVTTYSDYRKFSVSTTETATPQ
jgi:hypothetical protein